MEFYWEISWKLYDAIDYRENIFKMRWRIRRINPLELLIYIHVQQIPVFKYLFVNFLTEYKVWRHSYVFVAGNTVQSSRRWINYVEWVTEQVSCFMSIGWRSWGRGTGKEILEYN